MDHLLTHQVQADVDVSMLIDAEEKSLVRFHFQHLATVKANENFSLRRRRINRNFPDSSDVLTLTLWTFGSIFDRSFPDMVA